MIRVLTTLLLLCPGISFAQGHMNKTRPQLKNIFQQNKSNTVTETDTTLTVRSGPGASANTYLYSFDHTGKCQSERITGGCLDCYQKLLKTVLNQKKYGWKKMNENQYISNYESKILIELPVNDNDWSFLIIRTNWTKEMYDMLLSN